MKKLTLIFTLLFSTVMFSSTSSAEWTEIGENVGRDTYYVDFERIRKVDGYVYFWLRLLPFICLGLIKAS